MLIKRNVYFSAYDEDGEERLYSTTEVMDELDYLENLYSDSDNDNVDSLKAAGIGGAAAAGVGAGTYFGTKGVAAKAAKRAALQDKIERELLSGNPDTIKNLEARLGRVKGTNPILGGAKRQRIIKELKQQIAAGKEVPTEVLEKGLNKIKAGKIRGGIEAVASKLHGAGKVGKGLTAAGTVAAGTAIGYGVHKLKNRNK